MAEWVDGYRVAPRHRVLALIDQLENAAGSRDVRRTSSVHMGASPVKFRPARRTCRLNAPHAVERSGGAPIGHHAAQPIQNHGVYGGSHQQRGVAT